MANMAAVIHEKGTPDVLRWEEWPVGDPGPGEMRIRHGAVGVNYVDTYHRRGMPHPWPVPDLPLVLGFEGAGVVEAVGAEVTDFAVGDRVGYAYPPHGAYSQVRCYPADRCVKLPDAIDDIQAAGMMLKGLTAQYLIRRTYAVQPGDTVLVHAASGGMGLILCQWCNAIGATVIGTVSTPEKAELAVANGCHHAVVRSEKSFVDVVKEVTDGEGLPVVYESIGKDTFMDSLDCLRPLGIMASFGHASGEPPDVNVVDLGARGSLFVTRPAIMHYMAERKHIVAGAADLFDAVMNLGVKITVNHTWPLREANAAHAAVESAKTTGSVVLLPEA